MFRTFVPHPETTILNILFTEPKIRDEYNRFWTPLICNINMTNAAGWDEYIPLWRALKLQSRYNSPIFTSHGLGHSMTTAYFMDMFLRKSYHMFETNEKITRNMVLWTGLLHDIGYCEYDLCQQGNCREMKQRLTPFLDDDANIHATGLSGEAYHKNKFLHAQLGVNMVQHILSKSPRLFSTLVEDKMLNAIREHNTDSHSTTRYEPHKDGTFMSLSDQQIRRHYKRVNMDMEPLLGLLRISDNLDMSRGRLTPDQRSLILISYQKWYYENSRASPLDRKTEWARLHSKCGVIRESPTLKVLFRKSDSKDFLFTYSSWIIEHVRILEYDWNQPYLAIDVLFFKPPHEELRLEHNWNAALYQIKRLKDALESIYIYGHDLSRVTFVKMLLGVHPIHEVLDIQSYEDYIKYAMRVI